MVGGGVAVLHDEKTVGVEAVTRALPDQGSGERDAVRLRDASTAGTTTVPSDGAGPRRALAEFLDRFADAFARGDLAAIAACHVTPVLFVTEWDSTIFSSAREVAEGFRQVVDDHRSRGFVSLSHRVETASTAASRLVEVGVQVDLPRRGGASPAPRPVPVLLRRVDEQGLLINAVVVLGGSPVGAL